MNKVNGAFFAVRAMTGAQVTGDRFASDHPAKRKLLSLISDNARISVVTSFSQEGKPSP
jgi:hypothetical protein